MATIPLHYCTLAEFHFASLYYMMNASLSQNRLQRILRCLQEGE